MPDGTAAGTHQDTLARTYTLMNALLRFIKSADETGDFSKFWFPVIAVFIVHNIGEVAGNMPEWGKEHFAVLSWAGNYQLEFGIMVAILVSAIIIVAVSFRKNHKITRRLMEIFAIVMILNCIWHTCTSIYAGSISPGLFEALILGLPVYSYTLYCLIRYEKRSREDSHRLRV
jgi:hypothetical protein